MEISYRKDGNQNFIIIKEEEVNENDYKFQMLINNDIEGIIPLSIKTINNRQEIHYNITSMTSMENVYARKQMSGKDIYNLIKSIKDVSENMRKYLLDVNSIMFEAEFIYLNKQNEKYKFCYYPSETENFQNELRTFFDKLLGYINHNDKTAVLIAYGIQQITISEDFTIQDLMECAKKNIKDQEYKHKKVSVNLDSCDKEIHSEQKVNLHKKEKKRFFENVLKIFKGKRAFRDEEELVYEKEYMRNNNDSDNKLEQLNYTAEDMEDATMLLTSGGAIDVITLKSVNAEECMEITPSRFPCIVGKSKKSSDFYVDSPVISRVHMRICEENAGYYVEDLNSTNGTFVNGVQLEPHELTEINVGDQITIANVDFVVEPAE